MVAGDENSLGFVEVVSIASNLHQVVDTVEVGVGSTAAATVVVMAVVGGWWWWWWLAGTVEAVAA